MRDDSVERRENQNLRKDGHGGDTIDAEGRVESARYKQERSIYTCWQIWATVGSRYDAYVSALAQESRQINRVLGPRN